MVGSCSGGGREEVAHTRRRPCQHRLRWWPSGGPRLLPVALSLRAASDSPEGGGVERWVVGQAAGGQAHEAAVQRRYGLCSKVAVECYGKEWMKAWRVTGWPGGRCKRPWYTSATPPRACPPPPTRDCQRWCQVPAPMPAARSPAQQWHAIHQAHVCYLPPRSPGIRDSPCVRTCAHLHRDHFALSSRANGAPVSVPCCGGGAQARRAVTCPGGMKHVYAHAERGLSAGSGGPGPRTSSPSDRNRSSPGSLG